MQVGSKVYNVDCNNPELPTTTELEIVAIHEGVAPYLQHIFNYETGKTTFKQIGMKATWFELKGYEGKRYRKYSFDTQPPVLALELVQ